MTDWEDLRTHLRATYRIHVDEREKYPSLDWSGLSFYIEDLETPRLVAVVDRETEGRQYVAISAPIGPMDRLDMPLILGRAGVMVLEAVYAVDGDLWLRRTEPADEVDPSRLDDLLRLVAGFSIHLEREFALS